MYSIDFNYFNYENICLRLVNLCTIVVFSGWIYFWLYISRESKKDYSTLEFDFDGVYYYFIVSSNYDEWYACEKVWL